MRPKKNTRRRYKKGEKEEKNKKRQKNKNKKKRWYADQSKNIKKIYLKK